MKPEKLLSIVGFFAALALSANAYFLKGIHEDIGMVKVSMATIIANSESKERRIQSLEESHKELSNRILDLEKRVR